VRIVIDIDEILAGRILDFPGEGVHQFEAVDKVLIAATVETDSFGSAG
jgi:hypothetical protein